MTTKDCYLSVKGDKHQTFNDWNNSVSNNPQYSNLNLNANHQNSFNGNVIQSQNIPSSLNSKEKALPSDQFSADNNHLQTRNDSITWSKNDNKKFSFLQKLKHNNLQDNENLENQNKASTTKAINNSTLSLHIAAYENSIEASGAEAIDGGNNEKKKARNKPLKNVKQVFNESTSKYNYYFEIPRQQEGDEEDVKDPEIMHFKASQKLLDPYEGGNDNNSGGGDGVLNHPQQPQQQQQEIKHSPTSTNHHPPQQDVQQQQEQQQQYYGHPQQPYFYPTGQMAPLNLPPPPGSFLAVDENNQAIGYIIPAQQWNPQQQQYPTSSSSSSATHSIRPRFSTSSQQQMFYQVQQQPLHRQVSNSNNCQLPEYWQQRPILISMSQHLQQQHGSSRRATTSASSSTTAAGFIPIQPKPGVIPHTVSRKRYRPPSPGTSTNPPGTLHQTRHQNSLSSVFPEFSIEATGAQFLGSQKRPAKKLSKDFGNATPHRISMALQANIHTEAVWALNALTVKLYDDSVNPPTLTPELLNSIVEHFWANLSLVYPKIFAYDEKLTAALSNGNDDDNDEEESECFWLKVVEDAKKSGETIKTKIKLPINHHHHHLHGKDLNSFSREGIKIISKVAEMPTKLKTWKQPSESPAVATTKKKAQGMSYEEYRKHGLPTEFSLKIAESTKQFIEHIDSIKMDKAKFSKWDDSEDKHAEYDVDVQPREQHFQAGNGNNDDKTKPLHHSSHPHLSDLSMIPSHIYLFLIPKSLQSFTELCLGWSNVIRGFAFNPMNQKLLVKDACLLRIIGKLLLLYVQKSDEIKAIAKIESNSEKAEIRSYLLDIANQLRDDAFTILSFMTTGAIELFDMDSEISYSIFDALIHWVVTSSIFSKHSLVPWGVVSPRDFSLEILAKICITDRNVDLLLSTGPWKRIEEFVLIISEMIYLGEDTQIREFALVIMCAMCNTSEPVCFTAALKTNIIKNIVNYLENVDATIYEVISTKGMEYRDHPDYIGTTTAMLKKAITILESMAQHEVCRKSFIKYIKQLDKLTLSQFIDKELITQIASVIHMIEPAATAAAAVTNIEKFEVKTSHVPGIQLMVLEKFD